MAKQWKQLYGNSVSFLCPYCLKLIPLKDATIEHEPPKSRQDELGKSKKFLVCAICNHEKGSLTADEYNQWKKLEFIRHGGKTR